jgi:hypothetical protein
MLKVWLSGHPRIRLIALTLYYLGNYCRVDRALRAGRFLTPASSIKGSEPDALDRTDRSLGTRDDRIAWRTSAGSEV